MRTSRAFPPDAVAEYESCQQLPPAHVAVVSPGWQMRAHAAGLAQLPPP
jgi:hypothetical protein